MARRGSKQSHKIPRDFIHKHYQRLLDKIMDKIGIGCVYIRMPNRDALTKLSFGLHNYIQHKYRELYGYVPFAIMSDMFTMTIYILPLHRKGNVAYVWYEDLKPHIVPFSPIPPDLSAQITPLGEDLSTGTSKNYKNTA